jgi:chaperonin GroEL
LSRPVTSKREKAQVSTISAHNNSVTGDMVAEAVETVGADGAITVEESKTTETVLEIAEGMQFDRGGVRGIFSSEREGDGTDPAGSCGPCGLRRVSAFDRRIRQFPG